MADIVNKCIKILCICVILDVFSTTVCFEGVSGSNAGAGTIFRHWSRTRRQAAAHRADVRRHKRYLATHLTTPSNELGKIKFARKRSTKGFNGRIPSEGSREQLLNLLKGHDEHKASKEHANLLDDLHHDLHHEPGHDPLDHHEPGHDDIAHHEEHHRERFDPCNHVHCYNGGVCKRHDNSVSGFHCACALGFRGSTCHERVYECKSCPKKHDCTVHPDGVFCLCTSGIPCLVHVNNKTDFERILSIVPHSSVNKSRSLVSGILMICLFTALCLLIHCVRVSVIWCKQRDRYVANHVPPSYGTDCLEISDNLCAEIVCCCCQRRPQQQTTADIRRLRDVLTGNHHATFDDYFDHFDDSSPPRKGSVQNNMQSNDTSFQTVGSARSSATSASSEKHVTWSPTVGSARRLMSKFGGKKQYGTAGRRDSGWPAGQRKASSDYESLQYESPQGQYETPQPPRARSSSISPAKRLDFSEYRRPSSVNDERGKGIQRKFSEKRHSTISKEHMPFRSRPSDDGTPMRASRKPRDSFSLIHPGRRDSKRGSVPDFGGVFTPIKFIKDKLERTSEGKTDEDESVFEESFLDGYDQQNTPLSSVEAPREDQEYVNTQFAADNSASPFRGAHTSLPHKGIYKTPPRNDRSENNVPSDYEDNNEPFLSENSIQPEETDYDLPPPPPPEDLKFEEQSNISNNRYRSEISKTRQNVSRSVLRRIRGTAAPKHDSRINPPGKSFLNKSFNAEDRKKSKFVDTLYQTINELSPAYSKHDKKRVSTGNPGKLEAQRTPDVECYQLDQWPSSLVKAATESNSSRLSRCFPGNRNVERKLATKKNSMGIDSMTMSPLISPVGRRSPSCPSGRVYKVREKGAWNKYKDKLKMRSQIDHRQQANSPAMPELIPESCRPRHRTDPSTGPISADRRSLQGGLKSLATEYGTAAGQSRVQDWVNDTWATIRWSNRSGNNNEAAEAQSIYLDSEDVTGRASPELIDLGSIEQNAGIAYDNMNKSDGNPYLLEWPDTDVERGVCDDQTRNTNNSFDKFSKSVGQSLNGFENENVNKYLEGNTPIQINQDSIILHLTHDSGTNTEYAVKDQETEANTSCTPDTACFSIQKQTLGTPPIEFTANQATTDESTNMLTASEFVSMQSDVEECKYTCHFVPEQPASCLVEETLNMSGQPGSNEQYLDCGEVVLSQSLADKYAERPSSEGNGMTQNSTEHDADDNMVCEDNCRNDGDETRSKLQSVEKKSFENSNNAINVSSVGEMLCSEDNDTSSDFSEVDDEIFIKRKSIVGIDDDLHAFMTKTRRETYSNDDNNTSMELIGASNSDHQNPREITDDDLVTEKVEDKDLETASVNDDSKATDVSTDFFDADASTYNDGSNLQESVQNIDDEIFIKRKSIVGIDTSEMTNYDFSFAKTPTNVNMIPTDATSVSEGTNEDVAKAFDMSVEAIDSDCANVQTLETSYTSCVGNSGIVPNVEQIADTTEHTETLSDEENTSYSKSEEVTSISEDSYTTGVSSLASDTDNETVIGVGD